MSGQRFEPVRPLRPTWQYALIAGALALLMGVSGGIVLGIVENHVFPWRMWAVLSLALVLFLSGTAWAAAQWMSPSGRASLWQVLLGFVLAIVGLALGGTEDVFVLDMAMWCLSVGSLFSAATAVVLMMVFRRGSPLTRDKVAVATGLAAGAAGFVAIQMHCPMQELWHLLIGHALLPVVWGILGYCFGKLAFR
jgi:hypothetical protein